MDGLLIDSEPLWGEAAAQLLSQYGHTLTPQQYAQTTGLRTSEFLEHWFRYFNLPTTDLAQAEKEIVSHVIALVKQKGKPMPGVAHIFNFFREQGFKTGLASSSPLELINLVVDLLGISDQLQAIASAEKLPFGKPHPQVYLNCAHALQVPPNSCICFEDSFNGMIAAKAAKMKCVMVPAETEFKRTVWEAADMKISTLNNFNLLLLGSLS